jgi:hypothetical protein
MEDLDLVWWLLGAIGVCALVVMLALVRFVSFLDPFE